MTAPKLFLGLETSCDETAAAVFTDEPRILSSVVASQHQVHAPYGGVVPELAARAHLRNLLPVIRGALDQANTRLEDFTAIAVHHRPGLVGALVVGVSAAKMLSSMLKIPLLGVSHLEGHVFACQLAAGRNIFPCVALIVSGGHTQLMLAHAPNRLEILGQTKDDAAGEALDKAAALMGLGFPGGPAIEREAKAGNPTRFRLPRPLLHEGLDFSFSGLKTALLYTWRDLKKGRGDEAAQAARPDLAASLEAAVAEVLTTKAMRALQLTGMKTLAVCGGVACNQRLRTQLESATRKAGVELHIPPPWLCTDNAAMAAVSLEQWRKGEFAPADLDALPH
jgi:N6-L-threonylcarbamoyladenine synthase